MKFISVLVVGFLFVWGFTDVQPPLSASPESSVESVISTAFASTEGDEGWEADTSGILNPEPQHFRSTLLINTLLNQHHYRKVPINDSLSSVIYDKYINAIDPNKEYFLKADIDYFEKYRNRLDDDIKQGNLDVPFQIFRIYKERANDRVAYALALLESEPDYSIEEELDFDREEMQWRETVEDVEDFWRRKIKSTSLNWKLSGKEWEDSQEILVKRYRNFEKGLSQQKPEDVYEIYMNAFTEAFDPHTSYFSPVSSDRFQQNMSHSLEGIGARLVQEIDYTKVYEVVPGGPASKSKDIFKDDLIVGVAQGDDGEFEDIVGWRLDDVVAKIKGPKGTIVQLLLQRKDASMNDMPDTLRLERDKIKLADDDAKAEIIPISDGITTFNLGVITIPSFYINFEDAQKGLKDYKSVSRDVKKLITDLKDQGMNGLLIDLRNNGGGALQEAVDLTGLFIPGGPVVQVRKGSGLVDIEKANNTTAHYDGPLAVMTNRFSASASEIFSGAIQDYKRGVILGETTFGKGSVQNLVGLEQFLPNAEEPLGQLKLTLAKYYRVSGSSTQNIGVSADIGFPSPYDADEFGESSEANSLPWDQIASSRYTAQNKISKDLIEHLRILYAEDLENDPDMIDLLEKIEKSKENREKTTVSLNYESRKAEREANKAKKDELETSIDYSEIFPVENEDTIEKIKNDPYLKEGLKLLAEMIKYNGVG